MSDQRTPPRHSADSTDDADTPGRTENEHSERSNDAVAVIEETSGLPREYGGRKGPEPVRYGDWEKNGRCIDF